MSPRKISKPEELANCRDIRIAIRHLGQHEIYLSLLEQAQHIRLNYDASDTLSGTIRSGKSELQKLSSAAGGNVFPRRRPKKTNGSSVKSCITFIDECGTHSLTANDDFGAFVLAAIIVPEEKYTDLDNTWKQWKSDNLGSADRIVHEPDVRKGRGPFFFNGNIKKRATVIQSLRTLLSTLDFAVIACVINRPAYIAQIGIGQLDNSLPVHPYLMTLDFLMERLVLVLESQFGCARSRVIAEARGPLEDAILQYEYVRLQIDGTSYISPAWFRQQLSGAIDFKTKADNSTGLQISDLLARPCGEKILNPKATPFRWPECRGKLCSGKETAHSILGLKILPWDERYTDIWKS